MGTKAIGYFIAAAAVAAWILAVLIIRHRRKIAAKAGDYTVAAAAGAVKLKRMTQQRLGRFRSRVNAKVDGTPLTEELDRLAERYRQK